MLSQRRVLTLIKLLAWQGAALATSTAIVAWSTGQTHLYYSALITVLLKVILIPWVLHRLIDRLFVRWDIETLINIPTTMLIGIGLVIFAFALATPISQMATTLTRSTLGIALASVLLSFLMMIVRQKAVPQVIGFLAMENGLFFAATSATYGMPLVVELRSEEHTSELQSPCNLVCRLLLEKKNMQFHSVTLDELQHLVPPFQTV